MSTETPADNTTLATRMGSMVIGSPGEFNADNDEWIECMERLEHFFNANGIADENRKKSILLSSCGSKTYKLFRNLLAPTKPGDASWLVLKEKMEAHKNPKPSLIAERFKFNKRDQISGESVPNYLCELRKLSEHCEYGETLDDMLRDRLVCGLKNVKIQQKLLSETTLTLDHAFKIANAIERAEKDSLHIQTEPKDNVLHTVRRDFSTNKNRNFKKLSCFRCNSYSHFESKCPFKQSECFKCSKIGHISKACKMRNRMTIKKTDDDIVEDNDSIIDNNDGGINTIYYVRNAKSKPIIISPLINGVCIPMEVDTGASLSVINKSVLHN